VTGLPPSLLTMERDLLLFLVQEIRLSSNGVLPEVKEKEPNLLMDMLTEPSEDTDTLYPLLFSPRMVSSPSLHHGMHPSVCGT